MKGYQCSHPVALVVNTFRSSFDVTLASQILPDERPFSAGFVAFHGSLARIRGAARPWSGEEIIRQTTRDSTRVDDPGCGFLERGACS